MITKGAKEFVISFVPFCVLERIDSRKDRVEVKREAKVSSDGSFRYQFGTIREGYRHRDLEAGFRNWNL